MAIFDKSIQELGNHPILEQMASFRNNDFVISENARSFVINAYVAHGGRSPALVVTTTEEESKQIVRDLSKSMKQGEVALFPSWETLPFERVSPTIETMGRRSEVLWRIRNGMNPKVVVATARSVSQILTSTSYPSPIRLTQGKTIDYDTLLKNLFEYGYHRTSQVERRGEYAVRGSIIDIYPSTSNTPIRIDIWGDEIERLTTFSIADQRSQKAEKTIIAVIN